MMRVCVYGHMTARNVSLLVVYTYLTMKMEQSDCSETSAFNLYRCAVRFLVYLTLYTAT